MALGVEMYAVVGFLAVLHFTGGLKLLLEEIIGLVVVYKKLKATINLDYSVKPKLKMRTLRKKPRTASAKTSQRPGRVTGIRAKLSA